MEWVVRPGHPQRVAGRAVQARRVDVVLAVVADLRAAQRRAEDLLRALGELFGREALLDASVLVEYEQGPAAGDVVAYRPSAAACSVARAQVQVRAKWQVQVVQDLGGVAFGEGAAIQHGGVRLVDPRLRFQDRGPRSGLTYCAHEYGQDRRVAHRSTDIPSVRSPLQTDPFPQVAREEDSEIDRVGCFIGPRL